MKPLDKKFLTVQFRNKIHTKDGKEFQGFFEGIMEKYLPGFQRIKPYGNIGDGGNDGYIEELGIYYQVYAPEEPMLKAADAVRKLKKNFQRLKKEWDEIKNIKEYNFVFNDKYRGSIKPIQQALADLRKANPTIRFKPFLAKDLEQLFFRLDDSDILDLDFVIDHRQAIANAYTDLEYVSKELDRENSIFAHKLLVSNKVKIASLEEDNLSLEFEILETRCLQKLERIDEAKAKYEDISKRFPDDPRPLLYLAEIYLSENNLNKNLVLLDRAEKIDNKHWLLRLQQIVRKLHLKDKFDLKNVNEKEFPEEPVIKANFYRLYAITFEMSGDQTKADSFIKKAIQLNPDRFSSYLEWLELIENRMFTCQDVEQQSQLSQELLDETKKVEDRFSEQGDIGARNKAQLLFRKMNAFLVQSDKPELEKATKEAFELLLSCYLNNLIEVMLVMMLQIVSLPDNDFERLLEYLKNSKKELSDGLSKILIAHFNLKGSLLNKGKDFFREVRNQKYQRFINHFENQNYKKTLAFLKDDFRFAIAFANTLKGVPELRKQIIESLPEDKNIQKEKLWLLLKFDEKEFDDAYQIIKKLDLSNLDYLEYAPLLEIIHHKKAWDIGIEIIRKLLEKEKDEKVIHNLKLQLFNAFIHLKKYPELISLGEKLLKDGADKNLLDEHNKEPVLSNTIMACFERGKVDEEAFKKSKLLLEQYPLAHPTFEFKAGIEAEVYIHNNALEEALRSLVDGVKIKKRLSRHEYAKLYGLLSLKLGNRINLTLESLDNVKENTFVKLTNDDQWYFIGQDNELDALLIDTSNSKYSLFIDKPIGEKIVFENKYASSSPEEQIEIILPIERYIFWQSIRNFEELTRKGDLDWAWRIEVAEKGDATDFSNLLKFMEDENARKQPFFEMYCNNNYPLAALAVNEGGLIYALGRIQQENRGFIHFSDGSPDEFEKQKAVAKKVIDEKIPFYIDGTSALVLSEIGVLQKIFIHLPNLKVPQSVINLLADTVGRFRYTEGQMGYMGYARGRITFSSTDKTRRDYFQSNFISSIKLLESNSKNISDISSANKIDCFSERQVPGELTDACILAQKEAYPLLTEDYLYLKLNELETKKQQPEYFSSLALMKTLYEKSLLSFRDYLEYFGYLSTYRFRFLSLSTEEIDKAVFGDSKIIVLSTENIRRFNFPLTLSEEYGVSFPAAFRVVVGFLYRVLTDNAVTIDIAEKIFVEIIDAFPSKTSKKDLGQLLIKYCMDAVEKNKSKILHQPPNQLLNEKADRLWQFTKIYDWDTKLWTPN